MEIKYCGGCNPTYDRVRLAAELRERVEAGAECEDLRLGHLLVVICGCARACAGVPEESRPIVVTRDEEVGDLLARIRAEREG